VQILVFGDEMMPQASEELRAKWGDEGGVGERKTIAFLRKWGWKMVGNGVWRLPRPEDEITADEWDALQFLVDEWDHALERRI
jgi:hypothetical protein